MVEISPNCTKCKKLLPELHKSNCGNFYVFICKIHKIRIYDCPEKVICDAFKVMKCE